MAMEDTRQIAGTEESLSLRHLEIHRALVLTDVLRLRQ